MTNHDTTLDENRLHEIEAHIDNDDMQKYLIVEYLKDYHPADIAEIIKSLKYERRKKLINYFNEYIQNNNNESEDFAAIWAEVLSYLPDSLVNDVSEILNDDMVAAALTQLASDDALQIIEAIDEEQHEKLLENIELIAEDAHAAITDALTYPVDSAARIMEKRVVCVPEGWNVGQVIDFLRACNDEELPMDFYSIFVVDNKYEPVGIVALGKIITNNRDVMLNSLLDKNFRTIDANLDQEEVAYIFRKYGLIAAPVVENDGTMIGVITIDDIVDVISEEDDEDLLHIGGVHYDDYHSSAIDTAKSRLPWLIINLVTAILASIVIGLFEGVIAEVVVLAILLPITASMGGNAGMQTLTVAVRALSQKTIIMNNHWRLIFKETLVGMLNGGFFAIICTAIILVVYQDKMIGISFGFAMILTMLMANISGAAIPLIMNRLNIDPAISSAVFLTTITDICGFFFFLILADWLVIS